MRTSSSKKKAKKKKKKPSSPAAASAPAPQPAEAAGSPAPETLALASLAASETESSSSCEAATCTLSVSSFTASSSGPASTSSFSAFSSSASTASSSAAGEERRDLAWLLDAFASATIDQVDSAYREAGGDPFLAAGILGSSQDTMPPQPAPQPPPPPDLSPRSGSGGRKAGRRQKKAAVAATGMVADVIGKDYTRPATPLVSAPNVWKGKDGAGGARKYSVEEDGTRKYSVEEAEQFMCSMLGDSSELGMGVVRDVLGQYGYDVEKALDALLDISGVSSTQNMEANHTSAGRNGTCHPNMFPANVLSVENLTEGNTRCARQLTDEVSNTRVQSELGHEFLWGEPQIRWSMREVLLKIFMGILFFKGPFLLLYF